MNSFISDEYSVLNGTLVSLGARGKEMTIPYKVDRTYIQRIGNGVYAGEELETLNISEGIQSIGQGAFAPATRLKKMTLPSTLEKIEGFCINKKDETRRVCYIEYKRKIHRDDLKALKEKCIQAEGGRFVLTHAANSSSVLRPVYRAFSSNNITIMPPNLVDIRMCGLYYDSDGAFPYQLPFAGKRNVINTSLVYSADTFRRQLVKELIKEKNNVYTDPAVELLNDKRLAGMRSVKKMCVLLVEFGESDVEKKYRHLSRRELAKENIPEDEADGILIEDTIVNVVFHIHLTRVFFPALVKVVYSGQVYYIFRKCYLLPAEEDSAYDIEDYTGEVYDKEGNVISDRMAQEVLAKYKLLGMIM